MKVRVYYPTAKEEIAALQQKVAKVHTQAVTSFLQNLNYPKQQKLRLLDHIKNMK